MVTPSSYQAKRFRLSGLKGLSDESLELHHNQAVVLMELLRELLS